MKKVNVIVEHAGENLSAYINGAPIIVVGNDIREIETNVREAVTIYLNTCAEQRLKPVKVLQGNIDFNFKIDAATFINYYSGIFTKSALSRITGINERQLWHYAAGVHIPRKAQIDKIQNGINALTKELASISLL